MEETIKQLRAKLDEMNLLLNDLQPIFENDIIITKSDLSHLKWLRKTNSYIHLFEYKNSIRFKLASSGESYQYQVNFYNNIMNGTIDRIILNKIERDDDPDEVNYKLEEWHKTRLRDLYSPNEIV